MDLSVRLRRLVNAREKGWWSGETHLHFPGRLKGRSLNEESLKKLKLHMLAEDLNLAPNLSVCRSRLPVGNVWPPEHVIQIDADRLCTLRNWEDEKSPDSVIYFNVTRPFINPRGPVHGHVDRLIEVKRQQPEVWASLPAVNLEGVPELVATRSVDSIEIASHFCSWWIQTDWKGAPPFGGWGRKPPKSLDRTFRTRGLFHLQLYYGILNCGFRIPPSAGTAFGLRGPVGLGYDRVYVHLDEPFTNENWWKGFKAGRVFVTNGPILIVTANGKLPGEVFSCPTGKTLELNLDIALFSNEPVECVEIVQDGKVVQKIQEESISERIKAEPLSFARSGWFHVRAITAVTKTFRFACTGPSYVEVGDKRSTIHRPDVEYFLEWIGKRESKGKKVYEELLRQAE
ncbi:MAG TPA: CehA/McbA family metallohydrolase [Pirellulaceae bacterium]|nr:CehA/McbA family metallohydrolase [Pirellulaceae bacterium]